MAGAHVCIYGYYCHKIPLALVSSVCASLVSMRVCVSGRIFEEPLKSRTFWYRENVILLFTIHTDWGSIYGLEQQRLIYSALLSLLSDLFLREKATHAFKVPIYRYTINLAVGAQ